MLIVFFILVIVVMPMIFWNRITSGEADVGGVKVDNRKIFTELINENLLGKQIPGILAQTCEFAAMRVKDKSELELLSRIKMY